MPAPLIAFGLLNLPMLGWLAAAAAPVLIHLWSRQKYRETSWAAIEFLLAAVRRQARRLRFEQWLLLLVRTLLIVLLVLATAEPFWQSSGAVLSQGGQTHRVLVIDGSYSMAYKPTDKSRFEQAKQLARRIVEDSPQGDAFTLVLMSSLPRVVVGTPALEPAEVLQEIDNLQLTHTTIDLPATVRAIEQLVDNARRQVPHLRQHEVYFLTDLGRNGWVPSVEGAALADFRRRSAELGAAARLVVIDLGQAVAENIAVTGLRALQSVVTLAENVDFEVTLKNFGRQARARQAVELLIDGRRVAQQAVDVAPGGEAAAAFSYRFESAGDHVVEVRAEGDALDVDNHRWLVVPVRQSLRVLCVNGRPSGEPFRGATDYLASALSPQGEPAQGALVHAEVAAESALLERDLGRYDCVFVCDVAQFTASEARVLDGYLKNGGNLVFFLGEGVLADRYNRELGGRAGGPRLLPARLGSIVAEPQDRLDPLGFRHPIVQAFRGRGQAALQTVPVAKYFKLELAKNSTAKVALAMPSGDPLVVEERIEHGRVVLVATSADTTWTALPLWPSYVPLVQEMLAFCVGGQLQQRNVLVGEPIGAAVPSSAGDASLVVQSPDGRSRPVPTHPEGDYSTWTFNETTLSGTYTARFGAPLGRTQSFAVNVDTAESDLAQLGIDQLRSEVWPGVSFEHQTTWQNLDQGPLGSPIGRGDRLPVELLYGVLCLLLSETFLAWRFGHYSA